MFDNLWNGFNSHVRLKLALACAGLTATVLHAGPMDEVVPAIAGWEPMDRKLQLEMWTYDVFVCHSGPDKPFACAFCRRLPQKLRCFVDEESLLPGDRAPRAMEAAAHRCQVAVVLLCEQFFCNEAPQKELGWILREAKAGRTTVVPVFLGVTVEECEELAKEKDLEAVCEFTGLRHICECRMFTGRPVHREETLWRIVRTVRGLTGV